jgi:hypothetical protein
VQDPRFNHQDREGKKKKKRRGGRGLGRGREHCIDKQTHVYTGSIYG